MVSPPAGRTSGRHRAIVEAGIAEISTKGYGAASIRDIAKRARMSSANLYHHFDSKQDLLFFIIDAALDDLLQASESALREAGKDPVQQLLALVSTHVRWHAEHSRDSRIATNEISHLLPAQRRGLREKARQQQRKFDRVLHAGIADGVFALEYPHDGSRALASMCTAVATWFDRRGNLTPADIAERYQQLALRMLRP
jgi:AcrR family transcriptional regulator